MKNIFTFFFVIFSFLSFSLDALARRQIELIPLVEAIFEENPALALRLIHNGADVNEVVVGNVSTMQGAAFFGYTSVIKELVARNANVNEQDDNGVTALMHASLMGHTEIVKILLENNADVHLQAQNFPVMAISQLTAMHFACTARHTEIARLLIEYGSEIDSPDILNYTPFVKACENGSTEIALMLIDKGANIHQRIFNNMFPLLYSIAFGLCHSSLTTQEA